MTSISLKFNMAPQVIEAKRSRLSMTMGARQFSVDRSSIVSSNWISLKACRSTTYLWICAKMASSQFHDEFQNDLLGGIVVLKHLRSSQRKARFGR